MPGNTGGRYPLPYPLPDEPSGDGAAAIQDLAEAQHYANGLQIGSAWTIDSSSETLDIAYGVTFDEVPVVFCTWQATGGVPGGTGGAAIDNLRVVEVHLDHCRLACSFPGYAGPPFVVSVSIWVVPPQA